MKRAVNLILLIHFALSGCSGNRNLLPDGYVQFMEDESHEFRRKIESGSLSYTIQYATPEYVACKERSVSSPQLNTARLKELEGTIFFIIHIQGQNKEEAGASGTGNKEEEIMYYQFRAADDFSLLVDNKSLQPVTYHYENNYGLSPFNTIVVGFENVAGKPVKLTFHDKHHGTPFIKMAFTNEELARLPKLKII